MENKKGDIHQQQNMSENSSLNQIIDEDGQVVDLSFLDRPLMSRATSVYSYYKTIEQCRGDGIKVLVDKNVRHLLQILTQPNSKVKLKNGIDFKFCTKDIFYPQEFKQFPIGGYYSPTQEHIVICCDRMANQYALKETITHELIHVYDMAQFGDLDDCNFRACTEVRAYNMTGTCDDAKNQSRFQFSREECAKYHALLSTVPMCGSIQGRDSLEEVFDSCFNDHTPFDMNTIASNPKRSKVRRSSNRF